MQESLDPALAHERRSLPLHQQAHTARQLQELIDDPEDQALMVGPIRFQRDYLSRLRGGSSFLVPAGVELLVERDGKVSQILRNGRFDVDTWPAREAIRFFLVRTAVRTLQLIFEAEPDGPEPTLRALSLSYRVVKAHQLLSYPRPVTTLYSQARARLQQLLFLSRLEEATVRMQEMLAALAVAPEITALGLTVSGGVIDRWVTPRPAGPSAIDLLHDQVGALRDQQLVVDFREERGAYYVVVPLIPGNDETQPLVVYLACTTQYPYQPPVVFVRRWDGAEVQYEPPLLINWTPRYTLSTIVDAVKRDYEQP